MKKRSKKLLRPGGSRFRRAVQETRVFCFFFSKKKAFLVACLDGGLLTLSASPCHAQTCLPLQGNWMMNVAQSQLAAGLSFNPYFRVDGVELTMTVAADKAMTQVWQFDGPHIHEAVTYSFAINGRSQTTRAHSDLDSVPLDVVPAWQNCTLIVDARSSLFGSDVWTHNVYVLDATGRRLSILQSGRSNIGHTERNLVFDRMDTP